MGEYADDIIDRWIGDCNWGSRRSHRVRREPLKICRDCGEGGLIWKNEGHWYLAEYDAKSKSCVKHACKLKNAFKVAGTLR